MPQPKVDYLTPISENCHTKVFEPGDGGKIDIRNIKRCLVYYIDKFYKAMNTYYDSKKIQLGWAAGISDLEIVIFFRIIFLFAVIF